MLATFPYLLDAVDQGQGHVAARPGRGSGGAARLIADIEQAKQAGRRYEHMMVDSSMSKLI